MAKTRENENENEIYKQHRGFFFFFLTHRINESSLSEKIQLPPDSESYFGEDSTILINISIMSMDGSLQGVPPEQKPSKPLSSISGSQSNLNELVG